MNKSRRNKRRAQRASGFTIVEVIVAMGVMVVGVMGMVALQTHTVYANSLARQMSTANQIAQTWLERFKQDSHRWNEPGVVGGPATPVSAVSQTLWLQQVNAAPGRFQAIPVTNFTSGSFDFRGNELLTGAAAVDPFFCVSFKPSWVYVGRSIRVDVRVYWPRERVSAVVSCFDNDASLNPGGPLFNQFHQIYLSTVVNHTRVDR